MTPCRCAWCGAVILDRGTHEPHAQHPANPRCYHVRCYLATFHRQYIDRDPSP